MAGGLMQLVAYGAQDIYLTGNTNNTILQPYYESEYNHDYDNILYLTEDLIEIDRYEECIISLEQIQNNENIAKCSQCKKIVKYNVMQQWFNENESCPHCRGEYPEVTFLCGKTQLQDLRNSERKHINENNEEENPPSKKIKVI